VAWQWLIPMEVVIHMIIMVATAQLPDLAEEVPEEVQEELSLPMAVLPVHMEQAFRHMEGTMQPFFSFIS